MDETSAEIDPRIVEVLRQLASADRSRDAVLWLVILVLQPEQRTIIMRSLSATAELMRESDPQHAEYFTFMAKQIDALAGKFLPPGS